MATIPKYYKVDSEPVGFIFSAKSDVLQLEAKIEMLLWQKTMHNQMYDKQIKNLEEILEKAKLLLKADELLYTSLPDNFLYKRERKLQISSVKCDLCNINDTLGTELICESCKEKLTKNKVQEK